MKNFLKVLGFLSILTLTACSKLSGNYIAVSPAGAQGMMAIDFKSGSKAVLEVMGTKTEVSYSVDGQQLKLEAVGVGNQIFEIRDDGSITTGSAALGQVILKKK